MAGDDAPRPLRSAGRERCLERLVTQLGSGELERRFGLTRISGLADLRAQVPVMDRKLHAMQVDPLIGFHAGETGAEAERDEVVAVWRARLDESGGMSEGSGLRAGLLQARRGDPAVDAIAEDDLSALGVEVLRLQALDDPGHALARLRGFAPALLVTPSAASFACLEEHVKGPLERGLPELRLLLASFDVRLRLRARVQLTSAGWIDARAGRLGLPSLRGPARAFTLALGSAVIELLPPVEGDRRGDTGLYRAPTPVWPEHAIVGTRYELVVSSPLGCLRMRTGEFVRVIGFDPPTALVPFPRPRVVRLPAPDPAVSLAGLSLPGPELAASVRAAFRPEDPALVAATIGPDPQSMAEEPVLDEPRTNYFSDTELGTADVSGVRKRLRPTGLRVQVELQGVARADFRARLGRGIDEDLGRRNPAYAHLRAQKVLRAPRIEMVPPGTFKEQWERAARRLDQKVATPAVRVEAGREG